MEKRYELSEEIYSISQVQEAIRDFSDMSDICYIDSYLVITGDSETEIDELFREFMNYVISL